jgi:hypothetical protein
MKAGIEILVTARVSERLGGARKRNTGYARFTESPSGTDVVAEDAKDEIAVRRIED